MKSLKIGLVALGLQTTTLTIAQDNETGKKQKCENKFAKLDANADDKISKDEFIAAKEAAEAKREEKLANRRPVNTDKKFSKLDTNTDGKIDKAEFEQARKDKAEKYPDRPEKDGSKHFAKMDTDNDGAVTKVELNAYKEAF